MKTIWMAPLAAILFVSGCGSGDTASLTPAQEKATRDAFHAKPDINTLSPAMRKRVEAMMAASKAGPGGAGATPGKP